MKLLIAHNPEKLGEWISPLREDESPAIRMMVNAALARSGDRDALSEIARIINSWPDQTRSGRKAWDLSREIELVCGLVADLKLSDLRSDLEEIHPRLEKQNPIYVSGALAALGDKSKLMRIHELAESENLADRFTALKMCGHLDDEKSYQIVKNAAESIYDPMILHARQVLREMNQRRNLNKQ